MISKLLVALSTTTRQQSGNHGSLIPQQRQKHSNPTCWNKSKHKNHTKPKDKKYRARKKPTSPSFKHVLNIKFKTIDSFKKNCHDTRTVAYFVRNHPKTARNNFETIQRPKRIHATYKITQHQY